MLQPLLWMALIDLKTCSGSTAGQWASFTWQVFAGLTKPSLILPCLFALILLPWFVRSFPRKRLVSGTGVILLLLHGLFCSPAGISLGNRFLLSMLPDDVGQPADAIVVLGRGNDLRPQRTQVAADLWRANRAPLIYASGWGDAQQIVDLLLQQGLPQQAVSGESCSRTTEENALFTAAQLQPQGIERILLVTDTPHMLRSYLTFRSLGFVVIPHVNPLPPHFNQQKEAFLLVREYLGLASYGALGRFFPRQPPPAATLTATATATDSSQ